MSIICAKCGQEITEEVTVCPYCGYCANPAPPEYYQQPQPYAQQPYYQQQYPQQPYYQQPQPQYQYPQPADYTPEYVPKPKPNIPGRGFGITAMVLGIISSVFAFFSFESTVSLLSKKYIKDIPSLYDDDYITLEKYKSLVSGLKADYVFVGIITVLCLVFALIAIIAKKNRGGQAIAGLVLGIIALIILVISIIFLINFINSPDNAFEKIIRLS